MQADVIEVYASASQLILDVRLVDGRTFTVDIRGSAADLGKWDLHSQPHILLRAETQGFAA